MKLSSFFLASLLLAGASSSHAEAVFNKADGVLHVPTLRMGHEVYIDVDFRVNDHGHLELLRYTTVNSAESDATIIREIIPINIDIPGWYKPRQGNRIMPVEHVIRSLSDWRYFAKNYPDDPELFLNHPLDVDFNQFMLVAIALHPCAHGPIDIQSIIEYKMHIQINYLSYISIIKPSLCPLIQSRVNRWFLIPASAKPVKFMAPVDGDRVGY